jgi:hypothetical protein
MIKADDRAIGVLLVGRIIEEDEVYKLVEKVAAAFVRHGTTHFYLIDAKTHDKMTKRHP